MAESPTNDELSNFSKIDADRAIKATAQYISAWTQREFNSLAKNKKIPIIWPIPTGGYIIGKRRIVPYNGYWQLQNNNNEQIHVFESKQSAIFYCLCEHVNSHSLANSIRITDNEVMRLKNDVVHYDASLERAIKNKNSLNIHIWGARLHDARLKLTLAQNQLQKSIKSAKYLKVWSDNN